MSLRLHIGSGTIYLKGWVNVDVPSPRTFLASERPDLVERYATDESDYYARHREHDQLEAFREGPRFDEYVADRFGDWLRIPCRNGEAEELLSRQCFEHLSSTEAPLALEEAHRVLAPDGLLRLSVPDHEATFKLYAETHEPILVRHLLGPRRDEHGVHLQSYTRDGLLILVSSHGFRLEGEEPNIHAYPALSFAWRKRV